MHENVRLAARITPMSLQATCAYPDHALTVVERTEPLFSDEAKAPVVKRNHGLARKINNVCHQAIVNAAIDKRSIIDVQNSPPEPLAGLVD